MTGSKKLLVVAIEHKELLSLFLTAKQNNDTTVGCAYCLLEAKPWFECQCITSYWHLFLWVR